MKILTLIWFKFRFFEKNLLSGHLSLEPIFISWWQVKVIMGLKKFFDEKLHQKLFLTIDYYYQYVVFWGEICSRCLSECVISANFYIFIIRPQFIQFVTALMDPTRQKNLKRS